MGKILILSKAKIDLKPRGSKETLSSRDQSLSRGKKKKKKVLEGMEREAFHISLNSLDCEERFLSVTQELSGRLTSPTLISGGGTSYLS